MQNILTLETKKYEIKLQDFEGPLDLLCHLVEKNKMDIYKVNLSEITDQYIEYINQMEALDLDVTSEFLLMATTLTYIKSKSLLPKQVEDEAEITEEELIRRIIEYKKFKEISKVLKLNFEKYAKRIFKMQEEIELPKQKLEKNYEANLIIEKYIELMEKNKTKINQNAINIEKIAIHDTVTVASKVKEMFKELMKKPKFVFNKLFSLNKCKKVEVVTAFTGLLELTKKNKVLTTQEKIFGDIVVQRTAETPKTSE